MIKFTMMTPTQLREQFMIPGAIVLAGIILAITIYEVRTTHNASGAAGNPSMVRPVSLKDHVLGNPNAPVVVVEYADMDSDFSKQMQATMEQIMTEYAAGGKVAWVYRHFPLTTLHENAESHAEAAECAALLGRPDAFWRFIDALQADPSFGIGLSTDQYGPILSQLSVNGDGFATCLSSGRFQKAVFQDYGNALDSGAEGSPYSVILIKGQKPATVNGTLSYEQMKLLIDQSIAKAETATSTPKK